VKGAKLCLSGRELSFESRLMCLNLMIDYLSNKTISIKANKKNFFYHNLNSHIF